FFTKAGAIKLARYVEHSLSRYMSNRVPVALPSGPVEPAPSEAKPAERPLMGPVVPLTGKTPGTSKDSDELLGAPGSSPIHGDALAAKVLAKGETVAAPAGRADSFAWRPSTSAAQSEPVAPVAPVAAEPTALPARAKSSLPSPPPDLKQEEPKKPTQQKTMKKPQKQQASASSSASTSTSDLGSTSASRPRPTQDGIPRPPMPVGPSNGSSNGSSNSLFGWWR